MAERPPHERLSRAAGDRQHLVYGEAGEEDGVARTSGHTHPGGIATDRVDDETIVQTLRELGLCRRANADLQIASGILAGVRAGERRAIVSACGELHDNPNAALRIALDALERCTRLVTLGMTLTNSREALWRQASVHLEGWAALQGVAVRRARTARTVAIELQGLQAVGSTQVQCESPSLGLISLLR